MSSTSSQTFTRSHARDIAQKIAADMRQMNRFYGKPTLEMIEKHLEELTEMLAAGYLGTFETGFEIPSTNERVISLRYVVRADGTVADSDPGRVKPGVDVSDARYYNHLTHSDSFRDLTAVEQQAFEDKLPVSACRRSYTS